MIDGIGGSFGMMGGMNGMSGGMRPEPQDIFNRIDTNEDGGISKDEMQEMTDRLSGKTGLTFDMDELYSQFDVDEDGVLNLDEAKTAMDSIKGEMKGQMQGRPMGPMGVMMGGMEPDFQQMFDRLDEDDDSSIGKEEMQTFLDRLSEKTGREFDIDGLYSEFDEDEDGVLNSDEAKIALGSIKEEMKDQHQAKLNNINELSMSLMEKIASYQTNATDSGGSTLQSLLNSLSNDEDDDNMYPLDTLSSWGSGNFSNFFPISLFA